MKRFSRLALVLVALTGWNVVHALDVTTLCGDFAFFKDPQTRTYRGQFEKKKVTLDHVLVVTEVTDAGKAMVFYVYGEQPKWRIKKAGCWPRIGIMDGDTLTLPRRNKVTVTYKFADDGTASVKYVSKRGGGSTTHGKVALEQ